jgi:ribosomal protein S18 acetylase RimI-like enzyme
MIEVRPMTQLDLVGVVAIHRAAFPNFFLSFLGLRFLRVFYGFIAGESIALVALADGELAGFVAGVVDPRQFYRRLMKRRFAQIALAITPIVLRHPSTLARVTRRARQRTGADNHEPSGAELMSLAVDPNQEHRGIGRALVAAFAQCVAAAGEKRLWLTTDAADNDRVIHFYESQGFSQSREFVTAEGRAMVELTRDAELQS